MSLAELAIAAFTGVMFLLFSGLGILAVKSGITRARTTGQLTSADAEPVDVTAVTPGKAAVEGTAHPADAGTVDAPFTPDESLIAIGETLERTNSSHGTSLTMADRAVETVPFVVDDGTDTIRVEPAADTGVVRASSADGTFHLARDQFDPDDVDPGELRAWSTRTEVDPDGADAYRQRTDDPGEDVYVFGTVTDVAADGGHPDGDRLGFTTEGAGDLVVSTEGRERTGGASLVGTVVLLFFGGMLLFASLGLLLAFLGALAAAV